MALKNCVKTVANLDRNDVDAVLSGYQANKDAGFTEKQSVTQAVQSVINDAQTERADTLDLIYETYPELATPVEEPAVEDAVPEQVEEVAEVVEPVEAVVEPEPEIIEEPPEVKIDDALEASIILDTADVTGKERLDIMASFRAGDIPIEDIRAAYPAVPEPVEEEIVTAEDLVVAPEDVEAEMVEEADFEKPIFVREESPQNLNIVATLSPDLIKDKTLPDDIRNGITLIGDPIDADKEGLAQFKSAVVPQGTPRRILDKLKSSGIDVRFYDPIYATERDYVTRSAQNAIYSKTDGASEERQPYDAASRDSLAKTKPRQSLSVNRLKQIAEVVHNEFKGTQTVAIHIRETQDRAFGRGSLERDGRIKGGFYAGSNEMVLVAENIRNEAEAAMVMRHELVGHFGFRQLLNKEGEFDALLDRVYDARDGELKDLYDWVAKTYPELVEANDGRKIADEMLARSSEMPKKGKLIREIYEAIINLLRKYGIWRVDPTEKGAVTMAEIESLVRLSRRNLRTKTNEARIFDRIKADAVYAREDINGFVGEELPESLREQAGPDVTAEVEAAGEFTPEMLKEQAFRREDKPVVEQYGATFKTGKPVTFNYLHNKESATELFGVPDKDAPYGRGYEPSGRFMTVVSEQKIPDYGNFDTGEMTFNNPLVVYNDDLKWKKTLSDQYGGVTGRELSQVVITDGYDGIVTVDKTSSGVEYVSEVVDLVTFDPAKAMYRREDEPVGSNLGLPEEARFGTDWFVRMFQDSFNRIKILQRTIEERGGVVSPEADVYKAEERYSGKASARLDALDKTHMRPLMKQMATDGITLAELDSYLMAKHAPERNAYIASINPAMSDGGSGITNAEAAEILAQLSDKTAALESAANRVYAVNKQNQQDLVGAGLLTQEVVNEWNDRWDYYVPLKGKEGEDVGFGTGTGFAVTGAGIKSALGRGAENLAESPTAHSFSQAETGIVRAEKARVGQALIQLVRDNPDPAFWSINETTYNNFVDMYGTPFQGYEEGNLPDGLVENFDYHRTSVILPTERKAAEAEGRRPVPTVVMRIDPKYRQRDDVFSVMEDGKQLDIKLQDNLVAEQLKRLNSNQLNAVTATFGSINRYLAMVNTALNPEFVVTNLERDFQTAMVNLSGEQSAKMAYDVAKSMPGAVRGIWQATFDTKGQSEWRNVYEEMRAEGGTIGFFGLEDIDTKVKNIQRKLETNDTILGKTKRGILNARDIVLDANLSVENAARLAAYKIARDQWIANGMPAKEAKQKAASLSKNLTVNFNRKGELAPVMNSMYLFYNASIQGSARIFTALQNPRVQKIVGGIAATAFANALYNMAAGGDDEDGIPYWDKVPDYVKQTNIIIMHPDGSGNYSKIKLPYGYNVFWYTGSAMSDLMFNPRKNPVDVALSLGSATMNAFNPIQGADMLDTITPTVLKPFEQDVRNINFMGGPIRPEYKFDAYERPDSQKVFKSTNPVLKDMIQAINEATGGDETHSGFVDFSPETLKHYTNWLTGGMGMTGARALGTAIDIATGEEIEMRNVPFARTLGGKPSKRFDTERFYDAIGEIEAVKAQLKIYKGTEEYGDYRDKNSEVHKLAIHVPKYKKRIKNLRLKRDKAYADDDKELAREYGEDIRRQMMDFSMRFEDAVEAQK